MKKLFFLVAALAVMSAVTAQKHDKKERHNKDHSSYLPQKGDIATGVDLVGIVKFVGNSIAGGGDYENIAPFKGNFFAKYFVTDNIALRGHLALGVSNGTERGFVRDDVAYAADNTSEAKVTDEQKYRLNNFNFGLGVEFRRSLRRLQGYVGAEAFISTSSYGTTYKYGNKITSTNNRPSSYWGGYERPLSESRKLLGGGMSIFTGVDYFISRNVSFGFEFSLSGEGLRNNAEKRTYEEWDTVNDVYKKTDEERRPKRNLFSIYPNAGANLMFYF